jgi:hypothetical protein
MRRLSAKPLAVAALKMDPWVSRARKERRREASAPSSRELQAAPWAPARRLAAGRGPRRWPVAGRTTWLARPAWRETSAAAAERRVQQQMAVARAGGSLLADKWTP